MRKYLLATAAAVVLSTGAVAADLPVRGPAVAPAPIFVASHWAGFYLGAQLGATQVKDSAAVLIGGVPLAGASQSFSDTAIIGGLYAGYNWQFNSIVAGLELDANISGASKSVSSIGVVNFLPGSVRASSNFEGALVGKIGVAFDNALVYALGGIAVADFSVRYANIFGASQTNDNTRFGWTIGAGLAYKFTPNWSARVEYRYSDFGKQNHALVALPPVSVRHNITSHRIMAGLTYHFGGPAAAVVAKY